VRFIATPAEDAGGLNTGSGGRSQTSLQRRAKKMKSAMSNLSGLARSHELWARFRFSVIGPLLAAPPERGELQEQLQSLAAKKWHHPITGQRVQFGLSTIERWFYTARNEKKDIAWLAAWKRPNSYPLPAASGRDYAPKLWPRPNCSSVSTTCSKWPVIPSS